MRRTVIISREDRGRWILATQKVTSTSNPLPWPDGTPLWTLRSKMPGGRAGVGDGYFCPSPSNGRLSQPWPPFLWASFYTWVKGDPCEPGSQPANVPWVQCAQAHCNFWIGLSLRVFRPWIIMIIKNTGIDILKQSEIYHYQALIVWVQFSGVQ